MQLNSVCCANSARVVPRAHGIEAQRKSAFENGGKLDPLVAPQARVRRATCCVLGKKVIDHFFLELLREVPHVVGHAQYISYSSGISGVFQTATTPRAGTESLRVAAQREVNRGDVVSSVDCSSGGNR